MHFVPFLMLVVAILPSLLLRADSPFFRLASKFTDSAIEELLSRGCAYTPFLSYALAIPRIRPVRQTSLSLDRSILFSRTRVFPDTFHVRVNIRVTLSLSHSLVRTRARACASLSPRKPPRPLPQIHLRSVSSLAPARILSVSFPTFLLLHIRPVRNSDSSQGNVYPRRKMRLKCIGACFPRRAGAISTRILWVYHMTAPYLRIYIST